MKKYLPSITASLLLTLGFGALVAHAEGYIPLAKLPGLDTSNVASRNIIGVYLSGAIKLIIGLGGAFAILNAIIGGTQYVAAGISPDAKNSAKERITNAFIGLALILSSYLILNTINPKLVQFDLNLATVTVVTSTSTPAVLCLASDRTSKDCCPTGVACEACSDCVLIPSTVPNKGCNIPLSSTCYLNRSLLTKIQKIGASVAFSNYQTEHSQWLQLDPELQSGIPEPQPPATALAGWRITESWPPTVAHLSSCHKNGTCADLNNTDGPTDVQTIKTYFDAFKAAGLSVVYERAGDIGVCIPYTQAGIICTTYSTMTNSSSFHVN